MIKPYYERDGITIYHGDCLQIMPQLDRKFDLILTDPPYGCGKASWDFNVANMLTDSIDIISVLLNDGGVVFWFFATRHLTETVSITKAIPYRWQFIWYAANNMIHGDLGYAKYTACFVLCHSKAWRDMKDLIDVPVVPDPFNPHPTPKPIKVIKYIIGHATKEGQYILDPFLGSGTTLVGAAGMNRKAVGIEIDEKYCEISVKRIEKVLNQGTLDLT
jgi:site-specific DNA-methyltransferase (adenine-specific)